MDQLQKKMHIKNWTIFFLFSILFINIENSNIRINHKQKIFINYMKENINSICFCCLFAALCICMIKFFLSTINDPDNKKSIPEKLYNMFVMYHYLTIFYAPYLVYKRIIEISSFIKNYSNTQIELLNIKNYNIISKNWLLNKIFKYYEIDYLIPKINFKIPSNYAIFVSFIFLFFNLICIPKDRSPLFSFEVKVGISLFLSHIILVLNFSILKTLSLVGILLSYYIIGFIVFFNDRHSSGYFYPQACHISNTISLAFAIRCF